MIFKGWGKTTTSVTDPEDYFTQGVFSRSLRYAEVKGISVFQCRASPGFEQVHRSRHVCAGGEKGVFGKKEEDRARGIVLLIFSKEEELEESFCLFFP